MNKTWAQGHYSTSVAADDNEGWTAVELTRRIGTAAPQLIARVVFWDATGQYALEITVKEVPLSIVEELIVEAKAVIRVK